MDEKPRPGALDLLSALEALVGAGNISGASNYIHELYKDQEALPSMWFSSANDIQIVPLITKSIHHLVQKPLASWEETEFFFITRLLTLTCGPAYNEERAGMNEAAKRWMKIFSHNLSVLPQDLFPLSLWLFTFESPSDTLMSPGLETYDTALIHDGVRITQARQQRDRSLCRFQKDLAKFDSECGSNFMERLQTTGDFRHHCKLGCQFWSVYVRGPRFLMRVGKGLKGLACCGKLV